MNLHEKQLLFPKLLANFILFGIDSGYQFKTGECLRPSWVAHVNDHFKRGVKNSLHTKALAIDLEIYYEGTWLTGPAQSGAFYIDRLRLLGDYWERLGVAQSSMLHGDTVETHWGGRFGDYGHFSIGHGGVK